MAFSISERLRAEGWRSDPMGSPKISRRWFCGDLKKTVAVTCCNLEINPFFWFDDLFKKAHGEIIRARQSNVQLSWIAWYWILPAPDKSHVFLDSCMEDNWNVFSPDLWTGCYNQFSRYFQVIFQPFRCPFQRGRPHVELRGSSETLGLADGRLEPRELAQLDHRSIHIPRDPGLSG